jgi:hypothetical protein
MTPISHPNSTITLTLAADADAGQYLQHTS